LAGADCASRCTRERGAADASHAADDVRIPGLVAYEKLSTGDAFLGFVSYGVTMLLAATGGPRRHETHPYLPLALAVKAGIDAAQAAKLTVDQWMKHRAFCSWCLAAAAATFAVVPTVVPELRASWRTMQHRGHAPAMSEL